RVGGEKGSHREHRKAHSWRPACDDRRRGARRGLPVREPRRERHQSRDRRRLVVDLSKAGASAGVMDRIATGSWFLAAAIAVGALLLPRSEAAAQIPWREYESFEGADAAAPVPADWNIPAEFVVGRLMYPGGRMGFGGGDWTNGRTSWTDDYPKGDRIFIGMLRRFTRM